MAKDPAFLFYYQDFLVGIDHMTDEQTGQYIKCLCHQANRGSIREQHMKNICKTHDNFMIVSEKFKRNGNNDFYNERLRLEIDKRRNYVQSRRLNRLTKKTYEKHMENENENDIKGFIKPTIKEILIYCKERNNHINAKEFFDFYEAKGWMIGKNKMNDWKAAVRTWEQRKTKRTGASDITGLLEKELGKIATKDMIKKVMRQVPEQDWWKVDKYLKKRYPGGGSGFIEAESELLKEKQ